MPNVTVTDFSQSRVPVDLVFFSHQPDVSAGETSTTADPTNRSCLHGLSATPLPIHPKGSRAHRGRRMRSSPATTDTRFSCTALKVRRHQADRLYSPPSRLDCAIHEG